MKLIIILLSICLMDKIGSLNISITQLTIHNVEMITKSTDNSGYINLIISNGYQDKVYNICFNNTSLLLANVMCRQMNKGMAHNIIQYPIINETELLIFVKQTDCYGNEYYLSECVQNIQLKRFALCEKKTIFGLRCVKTLPNLIPSVESLETSVYVQDQPIYYLTCAMEENCLQKPTIDKYGKWSQEELYKITDEKQLLKKLLRFSSIIRNAGNAAFLPHTNNDSWQWHNCHEHFHSMDVFAVYNIYSILTSSLDDSSGLLLAGHKASFCLEDNLCVGGVKPYYKCSRNKTSTGNQGISPGCSDIYLHDIDCQWIDITSLPYGRYIFRLVINPQLTVGESNYFDNAIVCELFYFNHYTGLHYCHLTHPNIFW